VKNAKAEHERIRKRLRGIVARVDDPPHYLMPYCAYCKTVPEHRKVRIGHIYECPDCHMPWMRDKRPAGHPPPPA